MALVDIQRNQNPWLVFNVCCSLAGSFVGSSLTFGRILVVVASSNTFTRHHCL